MLAHVAICYNAYVNAYVTYKAVIKPMGLIHPAVCMSVIFARVFERLLVGVSAHVSMQHVDCQFVSGSNPNRPLRRRRNNGCHNVCGMWDHQAAAAIMAK